MCLPDVEMPQQSQLNLEPLLETEAQNLPTNHALSCFKPICSLFFSSIMINIATNKLAQSHFWQCESNFKRLSLSLVFVYEGTQDALCTCVREAKQLSDS